MGRAWLQMFWEKDETLSTSGGDMPGGECEANDKTEDMKGIESNGGVGSGEIASINELPLDRAAAGIHASTVETPVDETSTLEVCRVATGRPEDEELPVVAGRGDGSGDGNVPGVYESSVGPIGFPARKGEVGDGRVLSCAAEPEPERVLAIAGVAATVTAQVNGHR